MPSGQYIQNVGEATHMHPIIRRVAVPQGEVEDPAAKFYEVLYCSGQ